MFQRKENKLQNQNQLKTGVSVYAIIGIAASLLAMPTVSFAAEIADEAVADNAETVIVTAQKRAEDVNNVGVAISVISGDEIKRRNLDNVNKLQYQVPSFEITPSFGGGQPQFRLRGVGFEDYASNNTPTVGIYVDEIAYPIPAATQSVLFDIARIEVLRGPQGTLYGRNTTGGAVNFISNQPKDYKEYGASLSYESHDYTKFEGYISGPLTSKLKGRLAIIKEDGGAWQFNRDSADKLGDADRFGAKLLLQYDVNDDLNFALNINGGYDKSDGQGLSLFSPFTTNTVSATPGPIIPADTNWAAVGWGLSQSYADYIGVDKATKPSRDNDNFGTSFTANAKLGQLKLTSITSYQKLDRNELNDWDASSSSESDTYWQSRVKAYTEELRLAREAETYNWVAGIYYSDTELKEKFITDFTDSLGIITNTHYTQKVKSLSGFGQFEYLFAPQSKLIIGARVENEKRNLENFRTELVGSGDTFADGDREAEYTKWSGKIGLEHKYNDNTLIYASISSGIKSGGFTVYNSTLSNQIDAFEPERVLAYEIGFKSKPNDYVNINAAAFYYDYRDQQVLSTVINEDNGLVGRITNAPKSKIYGIEGEVVVTPLDGLRISQTLSYKHGEYVEFDDIDATSAVKDSVTGKWSVGTIDRSGQSMGFPEVSYNGAISYAWKAGDYNLRVGTDYAYRDNLVSWLGTDYNIKSYWLANANFDIQKDNSPWGVNLYVQNLTDEKYELTRNFFLTNSKISVHGKPRTFGIRVSYNH